LPKSQIVAKIPNCYRNPKSLPKFQTVAEIQTVAKILNCCQNPKFKRNLAANWILATIWDFSNNLNFGNGLGFWQQFGILATVWNFDNDLGFGIWDLGFRHMSNSKLISAYIGFSTQVYTLSKDVENAMNLIDELKEISAGTRVSE
jgi:hypothetical protein